MYYKIGLDIGIASVGWATVLLDAEDEPVRILDMGVRIFDAAERPKDGASLALPRREARSARRRLRRHRHRLARIKYLLEQAGCMSQAEIAALYDSGQPLRDIYAIRVQALDERLERQDWVRLLIHLAQRRGFKSNRKVDAQETKEAGRLTQAVAENKALMAEKGYRTIGEMLMKDEKFAAAKRNKRDSYANTVDRALLVEEIAQIFAAQRCLGNPWADEALAAGYLDIFTSQRSFDQGPGGDSPYGGDQIEKMIGYCTFEPEEKRAAKATYTVEYFTLLQKLNHLRLGSTGYWRALTDSERFRVVALARAKANLTYAALRKELVLPEGVYFSDLSYGDKPVKEVEKAKYPAFGAYHAIKKALGQAGEHRIEAYTPQMLNDLAYALTAYKNDERILQHFAEKAIPRSDWEALLLVPGFRKFSHLSLKACERILPYLEMGLAYSEACTRAGYDFQGHAAEEKSRLLPKEAPELDNITNPVVRRAVAQSIKVINAIITRYDAQPSFVAIELARELAKDFGQRRTMDKEMKENSARNERLKERIRTEFGKSNPTGLDIVKLKLWEEQDGICPYSLQPLDIERIFDTGYAEVDHIIPYSFCFDDRYTNKVLVHTRENQQKGNRLPMVYLAEQGRQDPFITWVKSQIKNKRKREALLKTEITPEEEEAFKVRNLTDTQYISRLLYNFIKDHLLLAPNHTDSKKTVMAVNGGVTAYMRKRWGISKIRADGDLHHAVDAVVIACVTDGMIKRVSYYSSIKSHRYAESGAHVVDRFTGEVRHTFPEPWPNFRHELDARLSNDPSARLAELYLPTYERVLYTALKERLHDYGGDGAKAFAEKFYKPTATGRPGPLVRSVKIREKATKAVPVHGGRGIADNESMVRIDVFEVQGDGYYIVPIYVADTLAETLPNKAIVAHKAYEEWKEMREEDFLFSLYPNDLIRVTAKKPIKMTTANKESKLSKERSVNDAMLYYNSTDISTAGIKVISHDNSYMARGLGVKTLVKLEKYQVDVLGRYHKVNREKRQGFASMKRDPHQNTQASSEEGN